jgi:CelD/BcsL family acetyltransferase involved in cellulose biosynthesis
LVVVNPLEYPQWDCQVSIYPQRTFFHSAAWARILHETYAHSPCCFCSFSGGKLQMALPVMEVSSRLTSRRGVSLPFSDFCAPLCGDDDPASLFEAALEYGKERKWKYLECRDGSWRRHGTTAPSMAFYRHVLALKEEEALFKQLDAAMRRAIRKAENAGVRVEFSATLDSVRTFFRLHRVTRQRHGLPPQPWRFFENIARYALATGHGFVAMARLGGIPVAASLFVQFGKEAIYKFGASDYAYQQLRANNLVMWEAIKRCASQGFERLDLGRTSVANDGLRRFKMGFGASEEKIEYRKYDFSKRDFVACEDRSEGWVNHVFRRLPSSLLRFSGEVLYPHLS